MEIDRRAAEGGQQREGSREMDVPAAMARWAGKILVTSL
jgi:hypothetical protein